MVLPVANQADHIERVVAAYIAAVDQVELFSVDFVLAVNNSADDSLNASTRLAARFPERVSVVTTDPGWGNAVRGGMAHARGEMVGFANSARTDPDDIARAIRYAGVDRAALVKSRRENRAYGLTRRVGSKLFNLECRMLFQLRIADVNGNPKVWHRDRLDPSTLHEPGSFLDAEVLIRAVQLGMPIVEFPITRMQRHGGVSMTNISLAMTLYTRPLGVRLGLRPRPAAPPIRVATTETV